MAAELRGDREGTAALVTDCDYLDEVVVALVPFAAEAARLAAHREVPDEALTDLASRHLLRMADGTRLPVVVPRRPLRAELPAIGGSVPAANEERKKLKPLLEDWRVRGVAAAGVVAGFLIGLVIFGAPWRLPPAWGDIPTWLLAFGAFAAAWIALLQLSDLRRQIAEEAERNRKRDKLLDRQIKESEQRALTFERQQAEMIDLEPVSTRREVPGLDPATDDTAWAVDVANRSPRPIRNVASRIEASPGAPAQEASLSGVLAEFQPSPIAPPGAANRALIDPSAMPRITLIRAGETGAFLFPVGARLNPDARMTVRFTDDAGLPWQIDQDLHLEKLASREDW